MFDAMFVYEAHATPEVDMRELPANADTLILLFRDYVYSLPRSTEVCPFPKCDDDAHHGAAGSASPVVDAQTVEMRSRIVDLATNLMFALSVTSERYFKILLGTIVIILGRHCRTEACCNSGGACALSGDGVIPPIPSADEPDIKVRLVKIADWLLGMDTRLAKCAKAVMQMYQAARSNERDIDMMERIRDAHERRLWYELRHLAPDCVPVKMFQLCRTVACIGDSYVSIMAPNIEHAAKTFHGDEPYFSKDGQDLTKTIVSQARELPVSELVPHVYKKFSLKKKKKNADGSAAPGGAAPPSIGAGDESSQRPHTDDDAGKSDDDGDVDASGDDASGDDEEERTVIGAAKIKVKASNIDGDRDPLVDIIVRIAKGELKGSKEDKGDTQVAGRITLQNSAKKLRLVAYTSNRSELKLSEVPSATKLRYTDMVYDPLPAHLTPCYAGGGEAASLRILSIVKATGTFSTVPTHEAPNPLLFVDDMKRLPAKWCSHFNTFSGIWADQAIQLFAPTNITPGRGLSKPWFITDASLASALAAPFVQSIADAAQPTAVAVFLVPPRDGLKEDYEGSAQRIVEHCRKLALALDRAAKAHRDTMSGLAGDLKSFVRTTGASAARKLFDTMGASTCRTFKDVNIATYEAACAEEGDELCAKKWSNYALLLTTASMLYPATRTDFASMFEEYSAWRDAGGRSLPSEYVAAAPTEEAAKRRMATTIMCGTFVRKRLHDKGGAEDAEAIHTRYVVGIDQIFQRDGEEQRYGPFSVLTLPESAPLVRGVLKVTNDFVAGGAGGAARLCYRIRGHLHTTLTQFHRMLLLDAVQTIVAPDARWAPHNVAKRWYPTDVEKLTVLRVDRAAMEVRVEDDMGDEHTFSYARHDSAHGTVVPIVVTPADEFVFEKHTRCPREPTTAYETSFHGIERLKAGDTVTLWTEEADRQPGVQCILAARVWDAEFSLFPGEDTAQLVFDVADVVVATPAFSLLALFSWIVVHRKPSTVIAILYSPAFIGSNATKGEGTMKTALATFICNKILGSNNTEIITNHKKMCADNRFDQSGMNVLMSVLDDLEDPSSFITGAMRSETTADKVSRQRKFMSDVEMKSFTNRLITTNHGMSKDALEKASNAEKRRSGETKIHACHSGETSYFEYQIAMYQRISPMVYQAIAAYFRAFPDTETRTVKDLQDLFFVNRSAWDGEVPYEVQFLLALHAAPRKTDTDMKRLVEQGLASSRVLTLIDHVRASAEHASESEMHEAALAFVVKKFELRPKSKRAMENADRVMSLVDKKIKAGSPHWAKLRRMFTAAEAGSKGVRYVLKQDVIAKIVEGEGFAVQDEEDIKWY